MLDNCPHCDSTRSLTVLMNSGPHHAKLTCGDCGKYIKWLPKPRPATPRPATPRPPSCDGFVVFVHTPLGPRHLPQRPARCAREAVPGRR